MQWRPTLPVFRVQISAVVYQHVCDGSRLLLGAEVQRRPVICLTNIEFCTFVHKHGSNRRCPSKCGLVECSPPLLVNRIDIGTAIQQSPNSSDIAFLNNLVQSAPFSC